MTDGQDVELFIMSSQAAFHPEEYDIIGFASGIYYGKFLKVLLTSARQNLPQRMKTFFVFTTGNPDKKATASIREAVAEKNPIILGGHGCKGFNMFGLFKLVGGITKGYPDTRKLQKTKEVFQAKIASV